ncbi:MAG: hypothetical protein QM723_04035 [Myxococcaceae bacterium]
MRQLVARMHEPGAPLSRNKHFHTFDNALGREALAVSKRLKALSASLAQATSAPVVRKLESDEGDKKNKKVQVEIQFGGVRAKRTTVLDEGEFELLCELPGMRELLARQRL